MKASPKHIPGVTPRALLAGLFGMALASLLVIFNEGVEGSFVAIGAHGIALPAMLILCVLVLLGAGWQRLTGRRLLAPGELLCVLFMMLLTVPLVSSGFWMQMIGALGSIPRTADFEAYDALPPALWPHGPNILAGVLENANAATGRGELATQGRVEWRTLEDGQGRSARLPVLINTQPTETASLRLKLPIARSATPRDAWAIIAEEPYLLTVLLRPTGLGTGAQFHARVYHDDQPYFATEAFAGRGNAEVSYLQPHGYLRRGMYGLLVPAAVRSHVTLEIGLSGVGEMVVADPELMSVGTLDSIYRGRRVVAAEALAAGGEPLPTELLARPAPWSLAGLQARLAGATPWRDWLRPLSTWISFVLLLLLASYAMLAILRRQWIDNERYLMPMTRIPVALIGGAHDPRRLFPTICYSRTMWLGFAVTLVWCLLRGWRQFNANVPDLNIRIELTPYFTDLGWGDMWRGREVRNVTFAVSALFLSLAIFMELNVLLSLVLGFFLFRAQYWFGTSTGLVQHKGFPYPDQQQIGAFIMYALLILFFTRKHWAHTLRSAWRGESAACTGEVLSYRTALVTLLLSFAGMLVWARVTEIPTAGVAVFFVFLLMIAIVAAKIRVECGTPLALFTPVALAQIIPVTGGLFLFGARGAIFISLANWIIFKHLFFLLPGLQLEMMELGRRAHLRRSHIHLTVLLGCAGGLLLGGWLFLNVAYGVGGDNYGERWPFMDKAFLVNDLNLEVAKANTVLAGTQSQWELLLQPENGGAAFAAFVTTVLTLLRQVFTGFWFHPVGFIVGTTPLMEKIWGSLLTAWIIRGLTLKLGGAAAVRERLFPFFVGMFLASLLAAVLFGALNATIHFNHLALMPADLEF